MSSEPLSMLFDLDGTLVDTDRYHLQALNSVLQDREVPISAEDYKQHIMGFSPEDVLGFLFPGRPTSDQRWVIEKKEETFRRLISELKPTRGAVELIRWARSRNIRRAVVTNAPRENTFLMLESLGLLQEFDAIVLGADLPNGKPHPLPYQTALERLGGIPANAVAFEDSLSGIRSASAAGILTFGITTSLDASRLTNAGAAFAIRDFADQALWDWLTRSFLPSSPTA